MLKDARRDIIYNALSMKESDYYKYSSDEILEEYILTYPDLVTRSLAFPKSSKTINGKRKYSIDFYKYISYNCRRNPVKLIA